MLVWKQKKIVELGKKKLRERERERVMVVTWFILLALNSAAAANGAIGAYIGVVHVNYIN